MSWVKLKAGALQLTMFIVVVIALLLASFILLIHVHKQFKIKSDYVIESVDMANNGINYALTNPLRVNDTVIVEIENEENKELKVHKNHWGVFEKITSKASIKNKLVQKIALIGGMQKGENRTALYLKENNKPLVLVGNTLIEGLCYLPKRGVKTGNIFGHSYYGSQLIYGETKLSSELPEIYKENSQFYTSINNNLQSFIKENKTLEIQPGKDYINSFTNPLQYVTGSNTITLRDTKLIGHIAVISKSKIVVESTASLKDVLLIAPEIEIRNNVIGTFQCFATKEINVGKNCALNYPSALVLYEEQTIQNPSSIPSSEKHTAISVNENSIIKGVLLFYGQQKSNNYHPQVLLENNTKVFGEVYCNQNLELKGTVTGSVYTSNFIASQFGSVYQNHIYNGKISINELPEEYAGLTFQNTTKKGIVKWLY